MDNSFAAVHPELVCEWSDKNLSLQPGEITYGSKKLYWWKGACGHEWQASPKSRSAGEKCPICSGARVIAGINDLSSVNPEVAKEWSERNGNLQPTMVAAGSHKKVFWKCSKGHEWLASVKSRTVNRTGCPYCSHNRVLEGYNDLQTLEPDIAREWSPRNYPLLPTQVTAYANRKVWWKCKDCGNEWLTLISTRSYGSKCPYCSGQTLLPGFNDLASQYPDIAAEWSARNKELSPRMVNRKSTRNVWWICSKCGYEWKAVIKTRVRGSCCPVCADRKIRKGYNDLAVTDPHLIEEWDYEKNRDIMPTNVTRYSAGIVWWKCSCGHSWRARISDRTLEGAECRICEQEYRQAFPRLMISYYARMYGLRMVFDSDALLGIPMEIYVPDENLAIETGEISKKTKELKEFLCSRRDIQYKLLPFGNQETDLEYAEKIKAVFRSVHIFVSSNTEQDVKRIRQGFNTWRGSSIK